MDSEGVAVTVPSARDGGGLGREGRRQTECWGEGEGGTLALVFLGGPLRSKCCGRDGAGRVAFRPPVGEASVEETEAGESLCERGREQCTEWVVFRPS